MSRQSDVVFRLANLPPDEMKEFVMSCNGQQMIERENSRIYHAVLTEKTFKFKAELSSSIPTHIRA